MITQAKALARMEEETRTEMRRLEDAYNSELAARWQRTLKNISACIMRNYRQDFGREKWDLTAAHAKGTLGRIQTETAFLVGQFKQEAAAFISKSLGHIHQEERLRALWMIDQTTPGSFTPKATFAPAREADNPRDAKATWADALSTWMETYHTNLNTNLRMEALHEGDLASAADEAETTRVDNFDPAYKLKSMFATSAIRTQADARRAIFDSNEDVMEVEIWQTMEDGIVCPVCEEYDGKPLSEVNDSIPAHYNCRCYSRFVPVAYSQMLSSGDPAEKEMALRMDDAGLIDDALPVISEKTGELIGRAIVRFEDWKAERGYNISGQGE